MSPRPTPTVDRRAEVSDEIFAALHRLNNALAVALGRLEICEDCLDDVMHGESDVLRVCLYEVRRGVLRAREHATQIAALTMEPIPRLHELVVDFQGP